MAAVTDHQETVTVDLGALLDAGDGAVVTLVAGKTRLVAHSRVLTVGSPVFSAMFSHDTVEASGGEVTIPDIEGPVLRQLLAFLYTHRLPNLPNMAPQLLAAADVYSVAALKDACEQLLVEQLALGNAAAAAVLAVRHSFHSLKSAALAFIKDHNYEVMATQGWADAVRHQPTHMIEVSRLLAEPPTKTSDPATTERTAVVAASTTASTISPTIVPAAAPTASVTAATVVIPVANTQPLNDITSLPDDRAVSRLRTLSDKDRATRLIGAARQGAQPVVRALLTAGVDLEVRDGEGMTALQRAAHSGHLEVVHTLLQAGAEVNASDTGYQSTPLHFAAYHGHTAVVQLLASCADLGARNIIGRTPLHSAVHRGNTEAVALLLEAGANRDAKDDKEKTALDVAREDNRQQLIHMLQCSSCS